MSMALPMQVVDADHPWLGLSPFTETTKGFFFGRDLEIRDIFLRVREQSLTVLYGQSGLGKTSLLGAGLIPKLKVEGYVPALVRLGYEPTDPPLIEQVFEAIRITRQRSELLTHVSEVSLAGATLWETFHHRPSRSEDLIEFPSILIFDQFEEIFTLVQTRERQREREELFRQLADLVENRPPATVQERLLVDRRRGLQYDLASSAARIVITLREDYLSQLEAWKKIMPALMRNRMALNLLNGPQALEAVVRPGRFMGRELVSDTVGARIVCVVARHPAGTPLTEIGAVPPLLSLLCDELNATRLTSGTASITEDQVERQSADILQNFYVRSFNGLHPAVRRFVEDRMVTVGGHRNPVAREDAIADLKFSGVTDPAAAIDQLIQGRLLSTEERGGLQRLEITHDVLAPLAVRSRDERKVREAKEQADRQSAEDRRRLRRARLATTMYGMLTAVSMIAGVWAWHAQGVASSARLVAEKGEQDARDAKDELTRQVYDNSIAIAEREISQNHDIGKASELLEGETCPAHLRGWEWSYLMRLRDGTRAPLMDPLANSKTHKTGLWGAEFSPDGKLIATCSIDGTLKFWNAETGQLIRSIDADKIDGVSTLMQAFGLPRIPIMCLSFSPDGKQVATGSFSPKVKIGLPIRPDRDSPGIVRIWDVASGKLVSEFQDQKGMVLGLTFSRNGERIASSSINSDNSFVVWEVKTGQVIKRVLGHHSHVHRLRYHPQADMLATTETDGIVKLWNASTFEQILSIDAHPAPVIGLDFSPPDGDSFATAGEDGMVRVWETATGKMIRELEGHAGAALDVRYSPDGKRIVSAGFDKTIRLWDAESGEPKITLRGHEELVWSVAFSPDGQKLVSASFDKMAKIWDATPRQESLRDGEFTAGGHTERVNSVALTSDSRFLVSGSWDNTLRIWDAQTGGSVSLLQGHNGAVWTVATSHDGKRIVSASWDHTAKVWDRQSGKVLVTFSEHTAPVHSVAFSPDGTRVVSGGFDGQVRIWDSTSGKVITSCDGFIFPVMAVAFSPDGKKIASGGSDRSVKIWTANSGALLLNLTGHTASIHGLAFSPDGMRVASASWDHTARIWDVDLKGNSSRKRELRVLNHTDRVNGLAYSADGTRVATASEDKTVGMWDAKTGLLIVPPHRHRAFVWSVAFTPDGKRLISANWEKSKWIRAWRID
jgi:WD40 repeat protein